jgi:hypothetical protein
MTVSALAIPSVAPSISEESPFKHYLTLLVKVLSYTISSKVLAVNVALDFRISRELTPELMTSES